VLAVQVLLPCVQGQADGIASLINRRGARVEVGCANVVEIEMLEIPTSGREDRRHRHLLVAIGTGGGGDWKFSRTNLRLAVGLQRESVMENSRFPSHPSSLPSL
jgi:hypothetical protein